MLAGVRLIGLVAGHIEPFPAEREGNLRADFQVHRGLSLCDVLGAEGRMAVPVLAQAHHRLLVRCVQVALRCLLLGCMLTTDLFLSLRI